MPVPPAKEVDVTVVGIDAHGMATAFRGCVDTVQAPPLSVWLVGLEVELEEAGGGGLRRDSASSQFPCRTRAAERDVTIGCLNWIWERARMDW